MPLHADDEAVAVRQLDSLDDSVGGPGDLAEPAAERLDRLVVHAVHRELERPDDGREPRALAHNRSEEHTSELQSRGHLVCRLLLEKKKRRHTRDEVATAVADHRSRRVARGVGDSSNCSYY